MVRAFGLAVRSGLLGPKELKTVQAVSVETCALSRDGRKFHVKVTADTPLYVWSMPCSRPVVAEETNGDESDATAVGQTADVAGALPPPPPAGQKGVDGADAPPAKERPGENGKSEKGRKSPPSTGSKGASGYLRGSFRGGVAEAVIGSCLSLAVTLCVFFVSLRLNGAVERAVNTFFGVFFFFICSFVYLFIIVTRGNG